MPVTGSNPEQDPAINAGFDPFAEKNPNPDPNEVAGLEKLRDEQQAASENPHTEKVPALPDPVPSNVIKDAPPSPPSEENGPEKLDEVDEPPPSPPSEENGPEKFDEADEPPLHFVSTHKGVDQCNRGIIIGRAPGLAHAYTLAYGPAEGKTLQFQSQEIEKGANGITNEALIAVLIDRLQWFQQGTHACAENGEAVKSLYEALSALQRRSIRVAQEKADAQAANP